ncbi:MAG: hypothetical protein WC346_05800 [Methanogenium sp.]|jgi:hypothetical protein
MLKFQIAGYIIHKKISPVGYINFSFKRENKYPYTVIITDKGLVCNCKEFYKIKTCQHTKISYNMLYVIDMDTDSKLHQQYWNLLNEKGLGKNLCEDFKIRLESLDEVTYESKNYIVGKYYSRIDGKYILITINKPNVEV